MTDKDFLADIREWFMKTNDRMRDSVKETNKNMLKVVNMMASDDRFKAYQFRIVMSAGNAIMCGGLDCKHQTHIRYAGIVHKELLGENKFEIFHDNVPSEEDYWGNFTVVELPEVIDTLLQYLEDGCK